MNSSRSCLAGSHPGMKQGLLIQPNWIPMDGDRSEKPVTRSEAVHREEIKAKGPMLRLRTITEYTVYQFNTGFKGFSYARQYFRHQGTTGTRQTNSLPTWTLLSSAREGQ